MPPSPLRSTELGPILPLPEDVSELPAAAGTNQSSEAIVSRAQEACVAGFPATLVLTTAVYLLATIGSALCDVRATVLDGIPLCVGPAALLWFYLYRRFPSARLLIQGVEAAVIIVVLGLSLACLSYIGEITALPLRDHEIIWVDRLLDFDWLRTMHSLDQWPAMVRLLDGAYATFTTQLILTVLVLLVASRTRELDRFFVTFVCASAIAELASVLIPTLGPMAVLAGNDSFQTLPTLGRATAGIVVALREGSLRAIDFEAIDGIISFPSLHAAVAIIVPFTLRRYRLLFWPAVVLNGLMFVSAVPSGNHYLADLIGGGAVAVLAIIVGRRLHEFLDRLMSGRMWNIQSGAQLPQSSITAAE